MYDAKIKYSNKLFGREFVDYSISRVLQPILTTSMNIKIYNNNTGNLKMTDLKENKLLIGYSPQSIFTFIRLFTTDIKYFL